jgi:hypothetical protein
LQALSRSHAACRPAPPKLVATALSAAEGALAAAVNDARLSAVSPEELLAVVKLFTQVRWAVLFFSVVVGSVGAWVCFGGGVTGSGMRAWLQA